MGEEQVWAVQTVPSGGRKGTQVLQSLCRLGAGWARPSFPARAGASAIWGQPLGPGLRGPAGQLGPTIRIQLAAQLTGHSPVVVPGPPRGSRLAQPLTWAPGLRGLPGLQAAWPTRRGLCALGGGMSSGKVSAGRGPALIVSCVPLAGGAPLPPAARGEVTSPQPTFPEPCPGFRSNTCRAA